MTKRCTWLVCLHGVNNSIGIIQIICRKVSAGHQSSAVLLYEMIRNLWHIASSAADHYECLLVISTTTLLFATLHSHHRLSCVSTDNVWMQMSKADKARMKKDKAKSFNNAGNAKSASKNAKRWN